ncbi:MAG: polysaccharide export protein [bacterium]|nr:polysaccharide export protein [bacterium]
MNRIIIILILLTSAAAAQNGDAVIADDVDVSLLSGEEPTEASIEDIFFAGAVIPPGGYTLGPGDVLDIKVYNIDNISGEYSVRYDGYLDFPYVGQIPAAGVSLAGFNDELEDKLGEVYFEPEVIAEVKEYKSCRVYVLGEVNNPGLYTYEAQATLLDIIAEAGGYKHTAARASTMVVRGYGDDAAAARIDMEKVIDEGAIALNIPVVKGDIIVVPKTFIANINQFITDITPSLTTYMRANSIYRTNWIR